VSFSPTAATPGELTNSRSAATLFKDSAVYLCLPLPPNPAKQKRPATSNVDRTASDARTGHGGGAGGGATDSTARGRPKTAAAATPAFFKPQGLF